MIFLISGATHTGKTVFAQKLLEKYEYPYLSIDHLKMGLIRSGNMKLTPLSPREELTKQLWSIVREIIKTAVENNQHLIVEGSYIPFDWQKDFSDEYLSNIKYVCIVMTEDYIRNHFDDIMRHSYDIENRSEECTIDELLTENAEFLTLADSFSQNKVFAHELFGKWDAGVFQ